MAAITAPDPLYMQAQVDGRLVHVDAVVVENDIDPNVIFIYVDNTLGANITNGSYSIASRDGSGSDGDAYTTIQAAIDAASVGITMLLRGGTYTESNIVIPNTTRGTSWASGNYNWVRSYPGEWAVFSGAGIQDACFTHAAGYQAFEKRSYANETKYWLFSHIEITGYAACFWFSGGPVWIRQCYLHDNISDIALSGAIYATMPRDWIVEYNCLLTNNQTTPASNQQYGHIVWDADYRDDELPTTFDPDQCTKGNIVRYNNFNDSLWGMHYKNQQRFGTNTRDPATVATNYGDYGDDIHHNIISNCSRNGLMVDQDCAQVHNNIVDLSSSLDYGAIQFGQEIDPASDNAHIYNAVAYNNGVLNSARGFGNNAGPDDTQSAPVVWLINNITDIVGVDGTYYQLPFVIAADLAVSYDADMSGVVIKNNLIHSNPNTTRDMFWGHLNAHTVSTAEAAETSIANNEANATSGLWIGATGSDKYIQDATFTFGAGNLSNAGIGGSHPYLSGVTIPSYIGPVNPNSTGWVAGVLNLADYTYLRDLETNPTWLEG